MTKEDVLERLCERARDTNLYFGWNDRGEPFVKTHGGSDLEEFSRLYGGRVDEDVLTKNPRYFGMLCWAAVGDHAIDLAKDLIEYKSFWTSKKFDYATQLVEKHESNRHRQDNPNSTQGNRERLGLQRPRLLRNRRGP